jgi:hypothetical protein
VIDVSFVVCGAGLGAYIFQMKSGNASQSTVKSSEECLACFIQSLSVLHDHYCRRT